VQKITAQLRDRPQEGGKGKRRIKKGRGGGNTRVSKERLSLQHEVSVPYLNDRHLYWENCPKVSENAEGKATKKGVNKEEDVDLKIS